MLFFDDLENVMKYYTKTGGFLTCNINDKINTMTVSWGFIGFFWKKPVLIVGVRPQRYTKEFIDKANIFTLSIPFDKMKEELKICGTKSGKDIDKSEIVNFIQAKEIDGYVVDGCDAYFECKIIGETDITEDGLPENIVSSIYKEKDFHQLYVGEIVARY